NLCSLWGELLPLTPSTPLADPMATSSRHARRRERSDLRLGLRVRQRAKLRGHTAGNCCDLATGLEACEVRSIAPRQRSTQTDARLDRAVVHDIDRAFVVGRALPEP